MKLRASPLRALGLSFIYIYINTPFIYIIIYGITFAYRQILLVPTIPAKPCPYQELEQPLGIGIKRTPPTCLSF
nr:hypothetical protein Q903MT_gene453 [Picea sitchensis]